MSSLQRIISTVQTFNEDIILSIKESAQNLRSKYPCMYSSQTLGSLWRSYLPKAKILPKITFLQNENLQSDLRYGVTAVSKKLTPKSNEMNNWGIYQNPFICLFRWRWSRWIKLQPLTKSGYPILQGFSFTSMNTFTAWLKHDYGAVNYGCSLILESILCWMTLLHNWDQAVCFHSAKMRR